MPAAATIARNFQRGINVKGSNNGRRTGGLREVGQPTGRGPGGRRETKLETFRRLAGQRVTNVTKALSLIQKLGNREIYEIRPSDVDKIEALLHGAVDDAVHSLRHGGKPRPIIRFEDEDT